MKNDDISDAELDAFLNGTDELSRRLHALPQPASNATLDAAILARVRQSLEQEQRPPAANDAGEPPVPRLRPNFATRWRMPVGIAATVLAGVFAHQAFQASRATEEAALMPALAEEVAAPRPASPMAEMPPPPVPAANEPASGAAPQRKPRLAQKSAPAHPTAAAAPPPPPPAVEVAAPAAKPAPDVAHDAFRAAAPAPAPVANLAERVTITGSNVKRGGALKEAQAWQGEIEALLKADMHSEARTQWEAFRKAYPDYPVDEELKAKLK